LTSSSKQIEACQSAYTLYLALRAWCVLLSGSAQVAFLSTSIYKEKGMSLQTIKTAIAEKKMRCPQCKEPVQKFDKFVEMVGSVWDGAGDSKTENAGSKVTLICGNGTCDWRERTEYWANYIDE
jgi:hypothetical protein